MTAIIDYLTAETSYNFTVTVFTRRISVYASRLSYVTAVDTHTTSSALALIAYCRYTGGVWTAGHTVVAAGIRPSRHRQRC